MVRLDWRETEETPEEEFKRESGRGVATGHWLWLGTISDRPNENIILLTASYFRKTFIYETYLIFIIWFN